MVVKGASKEATHQRPGGDRAEDAYVPGTLRKASGAHPSDGLYEWQQRADGKQPYRSRTSDLQPFAFAGLWEFAKISGDEILSAAIIVGAPNPLAAEIHDRMPVILEPEDYDTWLNSASSVDELRALLKPYPTEAMEAYAVSRAVNSVKYDTVDCIEPVGEPPLRAAR